jgi:Holliday junction DNA helicase RuvA
MIYSVTGKLICVEPGFAVVEAGGVGYRCSTTTSTLAKLPPRGSQVTLLTHLYLREDALELFGFFTAEELRCFRLLIGVSGVGPKAALAILSATTPQRLMLAIAAGDAKAVKAPGVGPKISQRIILELRDKVTTEELAGGAAGAGLPGLELLAGADTPSAQGEAVAALVTLGYGQSEAAAAVAGLDPELPVDGLIKGALRKLSRGV